MDLWDLVWDLPGLIKVLGPIGDRLCTDWTFKNAVVNAVPVP